MLARISSAVPMQVLAATLLLPTLASAIAIDWATVGDAGNAADTTGVGAVATTYRISKTEVTNSQYAEFLNSVAATDNHALYNQDMGVGALWGGITRSGTSGNYMYSTIAGRGNKPVNYVSFWDSLRFANWMHNGQGAGSTETGAYTITPTGIVDNTVIRNTGATVFLASENEWYKAAYYDVSSASYFNYPTGFDSQTGCASSGATANTANCDNVVGDLTDVGSYAGSASPTGTFDQGGNVWEWNEKIISGPLLRGVRGGSFINLPLDFESSTGFGLVATIEIENVGFRIAGLVPEPSTGLLMMTAMLGIAFLRRNHTSAADDSRGQRRGALPAVHAGRSPAYNGHLH